MRRQRSVLRLLFEPIALAVVLALIARTFVHIYSIPSDSMSPTLETGDHILVTSYGTRAPARGDVVVFHALHGDDLLVKRIVAVPGDLIESHDGAVLVGGHRVAEPYLSPGGTPGVIAPQIVPAACYFVMGDNRTDSVDSRDWGVLPRDLIVGRARLVLWSSPAAGAPAASAATGSARPAGRALSFRVFHTIE